MYTLLYVLFWHSCMTTSRQTHIPAHGVGCDNLFWLPRLIPFVVHPLFTLRHITLTLLFSFMISELYHRMNRRQLVIRCLMELPLCMAMELENKKWRILWKFPPNFNWFSRCVQIWIKYVCCVVFCTFSAGTIVCLICFLSCCLNKHLKSTIEFSAVEDTMTPM